MDLLDVYMIETCGKVQLADNNAPVGSGYNIYRAIHHRGEYIVLYPKAIEVDGNKYIFDVVEPYSRIITYKEPEWQRCNLYSSVTICYGKWIKRLRGDK